MEVSPVSRGGRELGMGRGGEGGVGDGRRSLW